MKRFHGIIGVLLAITPLAAQEVRYFPQVGDGTSSGIRFRTSLTFVNTGVDAEALLQLFDSHGEPLELNFEGLGGRDSSFTIQLLPGQVLTAVTPGSGDIQTGYAQFTAPASVVGAAVFTGTDARTDTVLFEAGVPAVQPLREFSVLLDSRGNRDTGLAIASPPLAAGTAPTEAEPTLTVTLLDKMADPVAVREIPLARGHKIAKFIHEFFADQPAIAQQALEMEGSLSVVSEISPIAAVTLRQTVPPEPFPAAVPTLTTFPVAPSAIPGTVDPGERVMVFAPHPDDEALGCAGALRQAVTRGDKVRVVVATCGDAYRSAKDLFEQTNPLLAYDRDGDGDFDMLDYGIIRHLESIAAMLALGIEPSDIVFLGYPDAGLDNLWTSPEVYQSSFTGVSAVPPSYDFAYRVGAPYSRSSFLADIKNVTREFGPTIIYATTDTDTHQDHWALAKFVRQALLELSPVRSWKAHYGYLIHWEANEPGWPHDAAQWNAPGGHAPPNVDLTLADFGFSRMEKRNAIALYSSQTLAGASYLLNFAKETEIFWLEGWGR